jgi:hypothetical protein
VVQLVNGHVTHVADPDHMFKVIIEPGRHLDAIVVELPDHLRRGDAIGQAHGAHGVGAPTSRRHE